MKEVLINGVKYLPATTLAKEFKYTTDYIGQLCRAKKVDAQLVGRSWYVNPESLLALRSQRYSRAKDSLSNTSPRSSTESIKVESTLAKTTVKMDAFNRTKESNFAKRIDWKPLRYEQDSTDLLPAFNYKKTAESIKVNLAEAEEIKVQSDSKVGNFSPEPLPEVVLKGKIAVTSLEEVFDSEEEPLAPVLPVPKPLKAPTPPAARKPLIVTPIEPALVAEHHSLDRTEKGLLLLVGVLFLILLGTAIVELQVGATDSDLGFRYLLTLPVW